ncbi:MAG: UDP-3-O-(3-hydroxymyristoyl)glucosamine N-acyltransferase [Bdellovibrionaceae bacterium]|nr:UDP-3-O-(3-hydroxymyristoyl)glucosamine N-acyltransferase [Pseudobdellovibrionaceae bacterium]
MPDSMTAKKSFSAKDLESLRPGLIDPWRGEGDARAHRPSPPELSGPDHLVFASQQEQLDTALARRASLIVAHQKLRAPEQVPTGVRVFKSPHVGLAMAAVLPFFDDKLSRFGPRGERHASCVVHPTARVAADVTIGPFAVIGEQAVVEAGCFIGAHVVIEKGARVGAGSILHPQCFIGGDCELGRECEIHPHATVGSDGFGFAQDADFRHHKLPQLGRVVLGDRVEIGANVAIDRAAFTETRIGAGSKIDNLAHIAHNCEIGENAVTAAGFMVAGSSKIGRNFMAGGAAVIADHIHITDDVMLAGRSAVTVDVPEKGAYGGYPLVPMKDHLRILSSLPHLVSLRKQMARVLKHLGLHKEEQ